MTELDKIAYKLYVDSIIKNCIPITLSDFITKQKKYNMYKEYYDKALIIERKKKLKKISL